MGIVVTLMRSVEIMMTMMRMVMRGGETRSSHRVAQPFVIFSLSGARASFYTRMMMMLLLLLLMIVMMIFSPFVRCS